MKTCTSILLLAGLSLLFWGCPGGGGSGGSTDDKPDLVITTFEYPNIGGLGPDHMLKVPIKLKVKNQGKAAAGIFKVSIDYKEPGGTYYVVPFTVPWQDDTWYPYTSSPLAAGDEITFNGEILFGNNIELSGVTVVLKAMVDSRSGDESIPIYGRVNESDEDNNTMAIEYTVPEIQPSP